MESIIRVDSFICSNTLDDAQLQSELRRIETVLSGGDMTAAGRVDLDDRQHALQQLKRFAMEDISSRPNFSQWVSTYVKVPLLLQMRGHRTELCKAACDVLASFARHSSCRGAWLLMSGWAVTALQKCTSSSVTAIVQAAQAALDAIVLSDGIGAEALGTLLKGCRGPHVSLRAHSMQTLLLLMQHGKGCSIQLSFINYMKPVCRVLRAGVVDGDCQVRAVARTCYWALWTMEPATAENLRDTLDPQVQKMLMSVKDTCLKAIQTVTTPRNDPSTADPHTPSDCQRRSVFIHRSGHPAPLNCSMLGTVNDTCSISAIHDDLQTVAAQHARHRMPRSTTPFRATDTYRRTGRDAINPGLPPQPILANSLTSMSDWTPLMETLSDTDWRRRLAGVIELQKRSRSLTAETANKGVEQLVLRVNDPHFQVCIAALRCLEEIMSAHPESTNVFSRELMLSLLANTTSRKVVVQHLSRSLLARLLQGLSTADAARSLCTVLDEVSTVRVKVCAVDVLQFVIGDHSEYFIRPIPMTTVIRRLLALVQQEIKRNSALRQAAVRALVTLFVVARDTFVQVSVSLLTAEEFEVLRGAVSSTIPFFESDCQCAISKRPSQMSSVYDIHVPFPFKDSLTATHASGIMRNGRNVIGGVPSVERLRRLSEVQCISETPVATTSVASSHPFGAWMFSKPKKTDVLATVCGAGMAGNRKVDAQLDGSGGVMETSVFPSRLSSSSQTFPPPLLKTAPLDAHASVLTDRPPNCANRQPQKGRQPVVVGDMLETLVKSHTARDKCAALKIILRSLTEDAHMWISVIDQQFFTLLERFATEEGEPDHGVRSVAFLVLHTIVRTPSLASCVARQLMRILLLCRAGMDDAFIEVQHEAASALYLLQTASVPMVDLILNALSACLERWRQSTASADATRGWLQLLREVGKCFERLARRHTSGERACSGMLTEAVLRRVTSVMLWCMDHVAPEVRRTTVLIAVTIWAALNSAALPFFVAFSSQQRKLISMYYNKTYNVRRSYLGGANSGEASPSRDLAQEMRALGLPDGHLH